MKPQPYLAPKNYTPKSIPSNPTYSNTKTLKSATITIKK